ASALDASKSGAGYKRLIAAPNFTLPTPDGETVSLDDYKGKVRLVVFFATWCPSCRAEAPDLEALQRKYGAKGLKVLALSKEEPQTLKGFAEKAGLSYTMLIRDKSLSALYG